MIISLKRLVHLHLFVPGLMWRLISVPGGLMKIQGSSDLAGRIRAHDWWRSPWTWRVKLSICHNNNNIYIYITITITRVNCHNNWLITGLSQLFPVRYYLFGQQSEARFGGLMRLFSTTLGNIMISSPPVFQRRRVLVSGTSMCLPKSVGSYSKAGFLHAYSKYLAPEMDYDGCCTSK